MPRESIDVGDGLLFLPLLILLAFPKTGANSLVLAFYLRLLGHTLPFFHGSVITLPHESNSQVLLLFHADFSSAPDLSWLVGLDQILNTLHIALQHRHLDAAFPALLLRSRQEEGERPRNQTDGLL